MIGTDTDDDPPMGGDSMELAPHGEKDEILSDDGSKSAAVERFGFLQEDHQIIQDLIAGVRRALKRKSITPQQICGLGKLLHGLERLPRQRWLRLVGQPMPFPKWRLADC